MIEVKTSNGCTLEVYEESTHPADIFGFIPSFLNERDERSMKEQFNANYVAGWVEFEGFSFNPDTKALKYPDDPAMRPRGAIKFRNETALIYPHSWVGILSEDGQDIEMCRMD